MYVATVPNRNSPPAILLRESFRLGGKVRKRTLSNLSHWLPAQLDALRSVLKGATSIGAPLPQDFDIVRSRPHGHVAAVLGTLRRLHLDRLIDTQARDRKSTRLNSSHLGISYAVFCLKKKKGHQQRATGGAAVCGGIQIAVERRLE